MRYEFTKEILVAASNREPRASKEVYDKLFDIMIPVVIKHHSGSGQVSTITGDCITKIFNHLGDIDPKAVVSFSRKLANNFCVDIHRKNNILNKKVMTHHHETATSAHYQVNDGLIYDYKEDDGGYKLYDPDVVWRKLEEAMSGLTPAYQKIFRMHYLDEMTHEQIGKELGITTGSSKSNLYKAKRNLRVKLGSYEKVLIEDFELIA